jgi:DNA modification methylase
MKFLEINNVHQGRSEILMQQIEPESVSLSFWSPPYFVGKDYEKEETYESWQAMLRQVIQHHFIALKPGGFLVINISDIRCFKDVNIPRFQAMNISMQNI